MTDKNKENKEGYALSFRESNKPRIRIKVVGIELLVLVDTVAEVSVISKTLARKIKIEG